MKNLIQFIKDFNNNQGSWIFAASIINKLILFLIMIFVLMYVEKELYGKVSYAISIIAFFSPFVGLGSPAGLLRYGSVTEDEPDRDMLAAYSFTVGLLNTIVMTIVLYPIFFLFDKDDEIIRLFLIILSFRMLALYLNNHQSVQFRIEEKNKLFGQYDIVNSLIQLVLCVGFTYLYNAKGYAVALVITPIISFIFYSYKYGFPKITFSWPLVSRAKDFWWYSLLCSFTNVVSQLIIIIDVIIIGQMLLDTDVAEYRAASLIPLNLLFLPAIFMKTDFTKIAQHSNDATFLKNYYRNYFTLFAILCSIGFVLSYLLGEWMFSILGDTYSPFRLFMILMIGTCAAILLRAPLGNMIAALGKARINTITGLITLAMDVGLNFYLIPIYGLEGAAWATTISLTVSGIMSWIYFNWYIKDLIRQNA